MIRRCWRPGGACSSGARDRPGDGRDLPVAVRQAARPAGEVPLPLLRRRRRQGQRLRRRDRRRPRQRRFGTITYTLDLGSKGNETHHWGYTDDRTRIWAGGLLSSRIWILDVATDPAKPRIEKVLDDVPERRPASRARTPTTPCRAGC